MDIGKPNTFLQLKLKEIAAGIKLAQPKCTP
jgi:hypothetical protein